MTVLARTTAARSLSTTASTPLGAACGVEHDRHPAAAARDDEEALIDEAADGVGFEQPERFRGRYDSSPSFPVAGDCESACLGELLSRCRCRTSARSASMAKRRQDRPSATSGLGDERDDAQAGVALQQRLLEQVADHADGFGADHVKGRRVCALVGLALEQEVTDLRAVAERQHELVRSGKRNEGSGSRLQVMALHLSRDLLSSARERVPAERGDDAHVSRAGCWLDSRRGAPHRASNESAGGTKLSTAPEIGRLMPSRRRARRARRSCSSVRAGGTTSTGRCAC